ncbi:MAG: signal peptidase I [Ilumatobacteraceae bacterium]
MHTPLDSGARSRSGVRASPVVLARARLVLGVATLAWTVVALAACLALLALSFTGRRVEIVLSSSMEPAIPRGAAVMIESVDRAGAADIAVGDVIAFRSPGRDASVIHRVIERTDGELGVVFATAGDANAAPDARPVQPSQLTGIVAGVAPRAGWWLRALLPPTGVAVLVGVPLVLWLARSLVDRAMPA